MARILNFKKYIFRVIIISTSILLVMNVFASESPLQRYMSPKITATKPLPSLKTSSDSPVSIEDDVASHYRFDKPVIIKNQQITNDIRLVGSTLQRGLILSDLNIQGSTQISLSEFKELFQIKQSSINEP